MKARWLLISAGLGSSNQEGAALRVLESSRKLGKILTSSVILTEELPRFAPEVSQKYYRFLNSETKGFGYFAWKPELVWSAFTGKFGSFDGVIWVDAGCEVNINTFTKIRLLNFMRLAKKRGGFFFTLNTPENIYTKTFVLRKFGLEPTAEKSPQVQATWFILHGELGRKIANEWFKSAIDSIEMLDLSSPISEEIPEFVEHRFDQSLLSLIIKNNKVRISRYRPAAGNTGRKSQIRAIFHPIWISRNRTGQTIIFKNRRG